MRRYIRHPSDIPIEFERVDTADRQIERLNDISLGGFSFHSPERLAPGAEVLVRIPFVQPAFEARCHVVWCRPNGRGFEVGVEFEERDDAYRGRMVEQLCHIEHYKRQVQRHEGRTLSGQEAALEWIRKFAGEFPQPEDVEE